jgi:hypothetical protein
MFKLILGFFTGLSPKAYLVIFCVLIALGTFFWFKNSIYQECKSDVKAASDAAKVKELEQALADAQQKEAFLLDNQRKNEDFIKKQRKALKDANEKDGDVAPVLFGTLERLHADRKDQ